MKWGKVASKDATDKIKNIWSSYYQELKEVKAPKKSETPTDQVHGPQVVSSAIFHSFLQPRVRQRYRKTNLVSSVYIVLLTFIIVFIYYKVLTPVL
jgi:hypothetical protein